MLHFFFNRKVIGADKGGTENYSYPLENFFPKQYLSDFHISKWTIVDFVGRNKRHFKDWASSVKIT